MEAWQRDYPNEFEEVVSIYADYYASQLWPEGQQGDGQQDSETPRYGDQPQLAYAGELGMPPVEGEDMDGGEPDSTPNPPPVTMPETRDLDYPPLNSMPADIGPNVLGQGFFQQIINAEPIKKPRPTSPDSSDLTGWLIDQLQTNAGSSYVDEISKSLERGDIKDAFKTWVSLVRTNGIWDLKPDIIKGLSENKITEDINKNPEIILGEREESFQAVANIHYGYVGGIVGFPKIILEAGAGYFQNRDYRGNPDAPEDAVGPIYTTANDGPGIDLTFYDQPYDNYWIEFGHWLSGQIKPDEINEETFNKKMLEYVDKYGKPPTWPKQQ